MGGRVLDARERLVDGERARHMFGSLCPQGVVAHTVNKGKDTQVWADNGRDAVWANSLERQQRGILLEGLCELDDARHVLAVIGEVAVAHTAIGGTKPLGADDSKESRHSTGQQMVARP